MQAERILESFCQAKEAWITAFDDRLQYEGRIDLDREDGAGWVFPATCVRIRFRGSSLKAVVTNIHFYWENSLGFILDGKESKGILKQEGITVLTLAESLPEGEHELCLFKRQDSCHEVIFHGFICSENVEVLPPRKPTNRRIEVYGDSISAGEVSEAINYVGLPDPEHNGEYSNSYYSYAWLTARRLGASLRDIAQGGAALLDGTGWFLEESGHAMGMESIWDKVTYFPGGLPVKKWDFKRYTPQVVIVAIGQNDNHPFDYMAEDYHCEQAVRWRKDYGTFLKALRSEYPQAQIICVTSILEHHENWDLSIDEVCRSMQDEGIHHFVYSRNGVGTKGHVRRPEAEKMADELSGFIEGLGEEIWSDEDSQRRE